MSINLISIFFSKSIAILYTCIIYKLNNLINCEASGDSALLVMEAFWAAKVFPWPSWS